MTYARRSPQPPGLVRMLDPRAVSAGGERRYRVGEAPWDAPRAFACGHEDWAWHDGAAWRCGLCDAKPAGRPVTLAFGAATWRRIAAVAPPVFGEPLAPAAIALPRPTNALVLDAGF